MHKHVIPILIFISNHMSPFQDIVEFHYLKIHLIAHFIGFFSVCVVLHD